MAKRPARVHGIIAVDKPVGWTSHDVVGRCRRIFSQRQVGHSGTLDPMATGALVVLLGEATKLSRFVQSGKKEYRAELQLGASTDSDDADGDVVEQKSVPELNRAQIEDALRTFVGEYDQRPPKVSAIKVGGRRLYQRVRDGEEVHVEARRVRCHELELLRWDQERLQLRLVVDAGYYVRSLGRDLAEALGTVGHLSALRRTQNAGFTEADLTSLAKLEEHEQPEVLVQSLLAAWPAASVLEVSAQVAQDLRQGKRVPVMAGLSAQEQARLRQHESTTAWAAVTRTPAAAEATMVAIVECRAGVLHVIRGIADFAMLSS